MRITHAKHDLNMFRNELKIKYFNYAMKVLCNLNYILSYTVNITLKHQTNYNLFQTYLTEFNK